MSSGAVAVEVPASSANLGPGFDAFAVALDVKLVVSTVTRDEQRVRPEGEGAGELPTGEDNLVWRAFATACEQFGSPVPDVSLWVRSDIPLERGMGSSAAAAVAGAALARAVSGAKRPDQELIDLAADLEGHPDNAAAATLGGLVVALDGQARRLDPSDDLRPVLCVPSARQSTEAARGLLPEAVPLALAAANGARAALVLAGLSGVVAWEPAVMSDVLHEPARLEAMADSGALVAALRAEGIGACLSGAGPTVLAVVGVRDERVLATVQRLVPPGWHVLASQWDRAGALVVPAPDVPGLVVPST